MLGVGLDVAVGLVEGARDGGADGDLEGDRDGSEDGILEGDRDGIINGDCDGSIDGVADGAKVGANEKITVAPCHLRKLVTVMPMTKQLTITMGS